MYLDDILIAGSTEEEHLRVLEEVLRQLEQAGLKVKQNKCVFMRPSVTYESCYRNQLLLPEEPVKISREPELVLLAEHLADSPVTASDIRVWTSRDTKLFRSYNMCSRGGLARVTWNWSHTHPDNSGSQPSRGVFCGDLGLTFHPQANRHSWQELHEQVLHMKALSRMYVWWPGINADIEMSVQLCHECQETQSSPPIAPLKSWKWPTRQWIRLHLDYAGGEEHTCYY